MKNAEMGTKKLKSKKPAAKPPKKAGGKVPKGGNLSKAQQNTRAKTPTGFKSQSTSQAITDSELRYRRLFETAQDGILIIDAGTGAITDVNPHLIKLLGYSRKEFVHKKLWELGAFKDIEASKEKFSTLQKKKLIHYEGLPLKAKDGRLMIVEFISNVYMVGDEKIIQCNIRDISESEQAFEVLQRRVEELASLQATVLEITALHDLPTLLRTIVERATRLINAPSGGLYLCEPDREEVRCVVSYNTPHDFTGTILKYGVGAAGVVAKTGKPLIIDDYSTWSHRAGAFEKQKPFSSVLSAPMIWKNKVIGVIHVFHNVETRCFTQAELELLSLFANHAANAVENAHFYETAQSELIERKRMEEVLRQSEARFSSAFKDAAIGMALVALDGRWLKVNHALCEVVGYTEEELLVKTFQDITHPDDLDADLDYVRQMLAGEIQKYQMEKRYYHKSGQVVWILLTASLVRDIQGRPLYFISQIQDITERKQADDKLRDREEHYRRLIEISPDAIVVHSQGNFVFVNSAAVKLFGASNPGELLGRPILDCVHPDYRNIVTGRVQQLLMKRDVPLVEEKFLRLDGSVVDVEAAAIPFTFQGNPAVQVVFRDITDRRQAQTLQEAVYRIASAAETTRSLDELFPQIHQIILSVMPAENFYITLYDKAQDLLRFPYFKDAADAPFVGGVQPGKGLTAYVLRTGKSLLCTQEMHNELIRRGEVILLGVPSAIWLGVPLIVEGKTIGAMVVQHYTDPKAYGEREQHMLEFVSTQVATAINRKRAEEALRESETKYRTLVDEVNDGFYVCDIQGVLTFANHALANILGFENPEALIGRRFQEFLPPEKVNQLTEQYQAVMRTGKSSDAITTRVFRKDDANAMIEIRPQVIIVDGRPVGSRGTLRDVTDRKRAEKVQETIYSISQAAISSASLEELYHSIHTILGALMPMENFYIALYDPAKDLLSFPYFVDQLEKTAPSMKPEHSLTGYVLRNGHPLLASKEIFERLLRQGDVELVGAKPVSWLGVPLSLEGRVIGVMATQSYSWRIHFKHEDTELLEFVSTQVAQAIERKRSEEVLRSLSLTDDLTGLYNRRGFTILAEQQVKLAHRMKRRMLLLFSDVDSLKTINDTWGHPQGDLALKEIVNVLKETFREADILARIGGDEFVVLVLEASGEREKNLASRLQKTLETHNRQADRRWQLSLSTGIARFDPEAPCTLDELIAEADRLMYRQKRNKNGKRPKDSAVGGQLMDF